MNRGMCMVMNFVYPSPIGLLNIFFKKKGIIKIDYIDKQRDPVNEYNKNLVSDYYNDIYEQLNAYFIGKLRSFELPLILTGTRFQLRVWNELVKIPYGEKSTYKEIAEAIGNPQAVRAVGNASRSNPIPILVPCHRIIVSNGNLTGYNGGLNRKEWLIKHENKYRKEEINGQRVTFT